MVYDIFYISKNIINEQDWKQFRLRFPSAQKIDNVTSFDDIKKKAFTKFFWIVWNDLTLIDLSIFEFRVSKFEEEFIHVFKNSCNGIESYFGGVALFPKNCKVSLKEFQYKFYLDKKEHDIVVSKYQYPRYVINDYQEYQDILKNETQQMFWCIWPDIEIVNNDIFDLYFDPNDGKYDYDRNTNHLFLNNAAYDGLILASKNKLISKKEFDHRFLVDKKEWSIVASKPKQYAQYIINNYDDYLAALNSSHSEMFWGIWSNVSVTNEKIFDTYFSHHDKQSRTENHAFKNVCNGRTSFVSGIILFSKNTPVSKKEIDHKFLINKKEYDIVASQSRYPQYVISNYDEYLNICQTEKQPLFWCVWPDIDITDTNIFDFYFDPFDGQYDHDRTVNHMFKNKVNNEESYISGVSLCCPTNIVSKKEFDHRFFIDKKEHDLVVSQAKPYDKFIIEKFEDYTHALKTSTTDMFWFVPVEVEPLPDFKFDLQFFYQNNYERSINHVFKNKDIEEDKYNGIMLLSKQAPISAREVEYRYLIEKKEYDVVASKLKLYDIVFISYNEPNADKNFAKLIERFPRAKRVHGVKGIHQAHVAAAKIATTPMFWVVDGDAVVEDDFAFELLLPKHDTDIVHVWLSRNPINNLIYGYGGVKLLPRNLTEKIDLGKSSIDMTMSISNKFKVMQTVSNITAFNTDPFNTWKSAFRECVKLASRPIDPKYQEETEDRLYAWCNFGSTNHLGEYAIMGATAGRQFGIDNIADPIQLAKINDFDWLLEQFQNPSPPA